MKVTISCHHLYIDGSMRYFGDEVEIADSKVKSILESDKLAKRNPRILVVEQAEVIKPKRTRRKPANGKDSTAIH